MSGLIDYPAQIWLAVAPVDMRRGLDGCKRSAVPHRQTLQVMI
ncbi:hypothetical protein [Methylomonas sp. UP202]|nr:hypothetical protein [Methylomonas sp. UP202]WGS87688.1 hypothetical protein QC632_08000 [Methylomonas sp. UP202]